MVYKKIKESSFIPSSHFKSILNIDYQPTFSFNTYQRKEKKIIPKKIQKADFNKMKYSDFLPINQLHTEYIQELKGNLSPDNFLPILYRAELTGAKIIINNKSGFIVEERVNTLFIIFEDDKIKIFPKNQNNFIFEHENIQYIFYGKNLKKNRFLRK